MMERVEQPGPIGALLNRMTGSPSTWSVNEDDVAIIVKAVAVMAQFEEGNRLLDRLQGEMDKMLRRHRRLAGVYTWYALGLSAVSGATFLGQGLPLQAVMTVIWGVIACVWARMSNRKP